MGVRRRRKKKRYHREKILLPHQIGSVRKENSLNRMKWEFSRFLLSQVFSTDRLQGPSSRRTSDCLFLRPFLHRLHHPRRRSVLFHLPFHPPPMVGFVLSRT